MASDQDSVHTVLATILEQETYKDRWRSKKQVKVWLIGLIKKQRQVQWWTEKREFGRRRITDRD